MSTINETAAPPQNPFLANQGPQTAGDYIRGYFKRVRAGDLGSLPIILGLVVIGVIFQSQNDNFLTPLNLVNLIVQMAGIATIAYGLVFILLLGEIDLSVGYVSAVAAVGMTLLLREPNNWPWYLAVAAALVAAACIGLLHGLIIVTFQVPSFVVTLAGFLAWNGVVLIMIGGGGTVIIQDPVIKGITKQFLPEIWGWLAAAAFIGFFALSQITQVLSRKRQGLSTKPLQIIGVQMLLLALIVGGAVYVANQDRGVPVVGIILMILLIVLTFVAEQTRFGRYVYAVGGNKEAARRAGIAVERIRVIVFMISSTMAGAGGIILASRLSSVDTNAGGGNLLLNSIAAAVIGGTSLFGGSGRVSSAILGALVIASVDNGMGLLGLSSGIKFIITGLVLLTAVIVDALSRRTQKRSGIA
ncbi:MAG: ABC transporter permease [Chitinophagaceae bacterium]|nr:ABC transporter permease [Anaerolineae bacterium]